MMSRFGTWFEGYVSTFHENNGTLQPMLRLKYDHCHRVARDAKAIALDLGWSEPDVAMAQAVGLFHDVGRFSQFREFGTFSDPKSINHAARGLEILRGERILQDLPPTAKRAIEDGVLYHNRRVIPADLSPESVRFLNLGRDADKLDDFFILNQAIRKNDPEELRDIIWNVSMDAPPNPSILNDLRAGRQTSYEFVKSLADFNLIQLSWMYDINFVPTYKKIVERRIVENIQSVLPPEESIGQIVDGVRAHIVGKISEKN